MIGEFLQGFTQDSFTLPLFSSLATGALIGLEREVRGKPAGLRTHALVCFAATLLTLAAAHQGDWVVTLLPDTQLVTDPARMAHGILTGIGFLGAGVIFREGPSVHGLTTAASLWITAALGIVFGVGMYWLAVAGALATLGVLVLLRLIFSVLPVRAEVRLQVVSGLDDGLDAEALRLLLRDQGLGVRAVSQSIDRQAGVRALTTSTYCRSDAEIDRLAEALAGVPGLHSASVLPTEDPLSENLPQSPFG
ncbi:MgtC/SapB family protein [Cereibacter changlensis]|uniref:Protein MgtC n=1 Tax=Cereibacter changlensis TaxID=402884 RepID=A0A4U0YPR4_9RHOB|nr:MgtC/SapB family protein [Cereibacter changlensis]TKA94422.1 MgtC/SapB family protein [Cereibacter changlensis]